MADLNKKALVEKIAESENLTKKAATEVVELIIDEIYATLKNGDKVDITGLGKFYVKEREARTGINPMTKEKIDIPAAKIPTFKASKALKDALK